MNTIINIKTDAVIKKKAQKIAENLGLSLSAVINVQLREFVKTKELYASEEARPLSKKFEKILKGIDSDIKTGKNMSGPFHTTEQLLKHLNSL